MLFAAAAEAAGCHAVDLMFDTDTPITIQQVKQALMEKSEPLAALLNHVWFAVNDEYVDMNTCVCEHDQIAVIPPVSGG